METVYIRLNKPPTGPNHARSVEGRAAAKNWDKLNVFAQELNAKPLASFLAAGSDAQNWYAPSEALITIRKLIPRISADRRGLAQTRLLINDLNSYENILSAAQARGSKFHFSADQE